MMLYEGDSPFAEYLEKMRLLEKQVKLVAYHTREAAEQTEKAAECSMLTVYHVKEALHER